ncbi:response regulator [Sphingomonas sp. NBWT7]|uniref:response regulator n=1 Tax=Sphingomonas sp. NBWT7 TaxID=2596913 RepID=UPI00162588E9|nr:response regulator [Sphingomonas sp. NBWT7]QNE31091.1 response regulator [Sphingomonas sp. NBWT7]
MSAPSLVAVVDDDEDVRISLEMLIGSLGHDAMLFTSADALLAAGGLNAFSCFISDVQMPGTDGVQLARKLRLATSAPVILITAFASEDVERRAHDAGVHRFLTKPFDPNVLIDELEKILG